VTITPLEAAMETDWLARGIGFATDPDGVVSAVTRANRAQILPAIENRTGA